MPVNARLVDAEQADTYACTHLLSTIDGIAWFTKVTNWLKIVFTWKFVKENPQFQLIKTENWLAFEPPKKVTYFLPKYDKI